MAKKLNQFDVATSPANMNLIGYNTTNDATMQVPAGIIKPGAIKRTVLFDRWDGDTIINAILPAGSFPSTGVITKPLTFEVVVSAVCTWADPETEEPYSTTLAKATIMITLSTDDLTTIRPNIENVYCGFYQFIVSNSITYSIEELDPTLLWSSMRLAGTDTADRIYFEVYHDTLEYPYYTEPRIFRVTLIEEA